MLHTLAGSTEPSISSQDAPTGPRFGPAFADGWRRCFLMRVSAVIQKRFEEMQDQHLSAAVCIPQVPTACRAVRSQAASLTFYLPDMSQPKRERKLTQIGWWFPSGIPKLGWWVQWTPPWHLSHGTFLYHGTRATRTVPSP